jgi:Pregnancy-associated plasma protein-A
VGIGSFPWKDLDKPWLHGVVVDPGALPTGHSLPGRHRGLTVAHEVGHYLGLIHTFQGGCADRDDVADTPAQSGPSMKCAVEVVDSCPDRPGVDDIPNIMNYTDDDCMAHFTPGQVERMVKAVTEFRPGLGEQAVAEAR